MALKTHKDALAAEIEAVRALLSGTEGIDPVGRLEFEARLIELEEEFKRAEQEIGRQARLALVFGGIPVTGARAIDAEFSGKVLESFQELVNRRVAGEERGQLGSRGPVPIRSASALAITDLVRGSMGFVLEESGTQASLVDSALKKAVEDVTSVVADIASEDYQVFDRAVGAIEGRFLVSIKNFFQLLDSSDATIRIVEDAREYLLDEAAIRRGRDRTERIEIDETESDALVGYLLGVLPASRRFEIRLSGTGEVIRGPVSSEFTKQYLEAIAHPEEGLIGKYWRTKMRIREVKEQGKEPRRHYTLLGLIEEVSGE